MADIRINSLPTTASASSSNDFLAIDGATNGTRKLSAYSPTFGGAVTINGNGTYGAIQLPSGTTSIYGVAFGTDTNLWRTDSGNLELGGSSVALIGLNVGGTNKGYFYNNGTDTTLAGAGTLTFKSNGTTTGLTLDSSNATVAGTILVNSTTDSSSKDTGAIVTEGGLGVEKSASIGGNLTVSGTTTLAVNTWLNSTDGLNRSFFLTSGTSYYKGHGSGVIHEFRNASDTAAFQLTNALNATLAGNLTVSGAGTSSVAGNLGIGTTNPNAKAAINGTADTGPTTNSNGILKVGDQTQTNGLIVGLYNSGTYGVYLQASDIRSGGGTPNYPIIVNPNGGNLLIGTAVDSSALLQVGTNTTTAAGGMKFGTDTSLYRTGGGELALDGVSGNSPAFTLKLSGTSKSMLFNASNSTYLDTLTAGASIIFRSGNATTALTLDSSQNATFAGTVTLPNNKAIYFKEVGGTAQRFALNSGDVIYIEPDQLHKISIGGAGVTNVGVGGIGVAGNSVFGGSIAIGNTVQTAASVASTHKVTISIGGTTYYLLATNV